MLRPPMRPGMVRAGPAHGVVACGAVARAYEGRGATTVAKTWIYDGTRSERNRPIGPIGGLNSGSPLLFMSKTMIIGSRGR